jgi:hypothetical protein
MNAFRVGQKVVCIEGRPIGGSGFEIWPVEGAVYTVRELCISPWSAGVLMRLEEIHNAPIVYGRNGIVSRWECAFMVSRFRPIIERKTDISIFKAMLNPSKTKETASC